MFTPFEHTGNVEEDDRLFLELASSYVVGGGTMYSLIGTMANLSALMGWYLENVNWTGFYLFDGTKLRLGPFQGEPACLEIPLGKGVCGTAAVSGRTLVVEDVHAFAGHIACSSASRSEIVVPIHDEKGNLVGVIDVDSPAIGRFSDREVRLLEALAKLVVA